MNKICNEDCLHCTYEDCILETVTRQGLQSLKDTEKSGSNLCKKISSNIYYQTHYDEVRARSREWEAAHRDEINARRREHYIREKNNKWESEESKLGCLFHENKYAIRSLP